MLADGRSARGLPRDTNRNAIQLFNWRASRSPISRRRTASRLLGFPLRPVILPLFFWLLVLAPATSAALPDKKPPSEGFTIDLTASEPDVLKAVRSVVEDQTIHGTYVYEKEKILSGAVAATYSAYYGAWTDDGHAFYKVYEDALAPRHFKNSADIGIITVRYVVQSVSAMRTHLRIDAVFVEDGSNRVHESDTTVESSEYAEIQTHLVGIQRDEQQLAESLQKRQLDAEAITITKQNSEEAKRLNDAKSSVKGLQQRANELQHDLEVRVINADTELKASPFYGAAKLATLPAKSDVLVEIITTYWYGIETSDGHRGWLRRNQVEPLP
jgi:hypothetical protein